MKKQHLKISLILIIGLMLFGVNSQSVKADSLHTNSPALPNPGTIVPVPAGKYATYSQGPHVSKFPSSWGIVNAGKGVTSSIDLGYAGTVVAPLAGYLAIMKDCGDHQVAVIRAASGWAVALAHVYINPDVRRKSVAQGQVIGKTVPPPAVSKGCGYGRGSHIHYTLMKWVQGKTVQHTEQNIVNTYIAQWIGVYAKVVRWLREGSRVACKGSATGD
jgi:hypothetical protein